MWGFWGFYSSVRPKSMPWSRSSFLIEENLFNPCIFWNPFLIGVFLIRGKRRAQDVSLYTHAWRPSKVTSGSSASPTTSSGLSASPTPSSGSSASPTPSSGVISFAYYLVKVVSFTYSLVGVISFAYSLVKVVRDSYIPFSLFSLAYYLQLTISNLLSSAYCLQLTVFSLLSSIYCLQLTVFNLLSSAYCLQLIVPKMQPSGMGWSCRLYNKVVSHEWHWQPCYVRCLLFRHGLITKLPLSEPIIIFLFFLN